MVESGFELAENKGFAAIYALLLVDCIMLPDLTAEIWQNLCLSHGLRSFLC